MVEQENVERLKAYIQKQYDINSYVNLLDMKISELEPGRAVLTMKIAPDKHTNLYNVVHGGAFASLADTAMGVVCATVGKRVMTIEMNINCIRNISAGKTAIAVATLLHNGKRTMVAEVEILDEKKVLLNKARGSFFVRGSFEDMPHD